MPDEIFEEANKERQRITQETQKNEELEDIVKNIEKSDMLEMIGELAERTDLLAEVVSKMVEGNGVSKDEDLSPDEEEILAHIEDLEKMIAEQGEVIAQYQSADAKTEKTVDPVDMKKSLGEAVSKAIESKIPNRKGLVDQMTADVIKNLDNDEQPTISNMLKRIGGET